jgi:hypothetical protein
VNDNPISWLQNWYTTQCDGDWEHDYGITIGTLDNPGWYVVINLVETPLEAAAFEPVQKHRSDEDWVDCRIVETQAEGRWEWVGDVGGRQYQGAGGSHNLLEIVHFFGNGLSNKRTETASTNPTHPEVCRITIGGTSPY